MSRLCPSCHTQVNESQPRKVSKNVIEYTCQKCGFRLYEVMEYVCQKCGHDVFEAVAVPCQICGHPRYVLVKKV